jgi:hypothetical protein
MEIRDLKLHALDARQDFERLVELYLEFQEYIEKFALAPRGKLRDEGNWLLEWRDEEQVLNPPIFSFVEEPGPNVSNPTHFEHYLLRATEKFERLIRKKKRALEELHQQIALLTSESEARAVTGIEEPSAPDAVTEKVEHYDEVEIGIKWAGQVLRFAPWAKDITSRLVR